MMRKVMSVLLGVSLVVGIGNIALGQVYLDKSLGNSGRVDKWEPIEVGPQLIGVPGGLGVGARLAYFFPYSNDGVDSKIAYEGIVSYMVNSIFATALSVGYTRPQWDEPVDGKSELTYMNLTFELRGNPEPNFGLYLGFGPSLIFTNFDSSTDQNIRGKDSFGMHAAIGIDYCVTPNIVINIDVKHLWFLDGYKIKVDDGPWMKEKLDSVILGAGVKYFF